MIIQLNFISPALARGIGNGSHRREKNVGKEKRQGKNYNAVKYNFIQKYEKIKF